jgi:hypothetical protein
MTVKLRGGAEVKMWKVGDGESRVVPAGRHAKRERESRVRRRIVDCYYRYASQAFKV